MNARDLDHWFTYHPPCAGQPARYEAIRSAGHDFASAILARTGPSPERAMAITKIREAVMMANAAIACEPVEVSEHFASEVAVAK